MNAASTSQIADILYLTIWENRAVKVLGITIDIELRFDEHLTNICIKANKTDNSFDKNEKIFGFQSRETSV